MLHLLRKLWLLHLCSLDATQLKCKYHVHYICKQSDGMSQEKATTTTTTLAGIKHLLTKYCSRLFFG